MPITSRNPFKGRHFPGEVILLCARWYLRYPLAYEHVADVFQLEKMTQLAGFLRRQPRLSFALDQLTDTTLSLGGRTEIYHVLWRRSTREIDEFEINRLACAHFRSSLQHNASRRGTGQSETVPLRCPVITSDRIASGWQPGVLLNRGCSPARRPIPRCNQR